MRADPFRTAVAIALAAVVGASLRWVAGEVLPTSADWPTPTFVVNLLGATLIGALLASPDVERRVNLAARVGLCGALTTFSAFAVETASFGRDGRWGLALAYPLATVVGALACFAAAARVARR